MPHMTRWCMFVECAMSKVCRCVLLKETFSLTSATQALRIRNIAKRIDDNIDVAHSCFARQKNPNDCGSRVAEPVKHRACGRAPLKWLRGALRQGVQAIDVSTLLQNARHHVSQPTTRPAPIANRFLLRDYQHSTPGTPLIALRRPSCPAQATMR